MKDVLLPGHTVDTEAIKLETLSEVLAKYKDRIHHVVLIWSVTRSYYTGDILNGATVYQEELDLEYSLVGDYNKALEFSEKYSVWDGCTLTLTDGILYGREINEDMQLSVNDGYDHHYRKGVMIDDIGSIRVYSEYDEDAQTFIRYWVEL